MFYNHEIYTRKQQYFTTKVPQTMMTKHEKSDMQNCTDKLLEIPGICAVALDDFDSHFVDVFIELEPASVLHVNIGVRPLTWKENLRATKARIAKSLSVLMLRELYDCPLLSAA